MARRLVAMGVFVYLAVAWLHTARGYGCSNRLYNGQRLFVGQSICSSDGMYSMYLASTGYLMLKDKALNLEYYVISSASVPTPSEVSFNASGFLTAISTSGQTYWSTGASGAYLELQNNGNVQLLSRNSSTGQYIASWTPGLVPLTTVVVNQQKHFIPGGFRFGLQLRVSATFTNNIDLRILDTFLSPSLSIAILISPRFSPSQVALNTRWNGVWRTERTVGLAASFVSGQASDIVLWADQAGMHGYSTRNASAIYDVNDMNLPLAKYKFVVFAGTSPLTVLQVSGAGVPSAALAVCRSRLMVNEPLLSGSRLCANDFVLRAQASTTEGGIVLENIQQRTWYLGATPASQPASPTLRLFPNGSMTVSDATTGFSFTVGLLAMGECFDGSQAAHVSPVSFCHQIPHGMAKQKHNVSGTGFLIP